MLAPQKGKPGGNRALGNNVTTDPTIIAQWAAQCLVSDLDALRKAVSTLQAKFALRGYAMHELPDGTFLVCAGWGLMSQPLPNLGAVQQFARMVGAA